MGDITSAKSEKKIIIANEADSGLQVEKEEKEILNFHGKRPNPPTAAETSPDKKQNVKKKKVKKITRHNRGVIDLDRQCGVIISKSSPCTRSLTCKSHSMSLKRGVVGRSQSYDILLAQQQKKFIGRFQNNNGVLNNSDKQDDVKKEEQKITSSTKVVPSKGDSDNSLKK